MLKTLRGIVVRMMNLLSQSVSVLGDALCSLDETISKSNHNIDSNQVS
jgi:hypothetical protein